MDPVVLELLKQVAERMNINPNDASSSSSKKEYHRVSFNYPPPPLPNYAPTPSGKVPTLTFGNYDEWAEKLSFHLIGLNPSLWELVLVGPTLPKEGEDTTPEGYRDLQLNAQVISAILGSLSNEEYRKVIGVKNAKVMWDTIKMSHEGDKKARRTNLEMVEKELRKIEWINGESL